MTVGTDIWQRMMKAAGKIKGFQPEGAKRETGLLDQDAHGLDSIARVELSLACEDEFRVRITDEEFDSLKTLGDIETLLKRKGC